MNTQFALSTASTQSPIDGIEEEFSRLSAQLRVFTRIPKHHHDVTALLGFVLVYETDALCRDGLEDGALYVVESQHPVGCMSWETYDHFNRKREGRSLGAVVIGETVKFGGEAVRWPMGDGSCQVAPDWERDKALRYPMKLADGVARSNYVIRRMIRFIYRFRSPFLGLFRGKSGDLFARNWPSFR